MKHHPDFDLPWCQELLNSDVQIVEIPLQNKSQSDDPQVSNTMFLRTLDTETAIRAQISFKRPAKESESLASYEYCSLMSIGDGVDGKTGRAHGGFNALILDHVTGTIASQISHSIAPATATMAVDYKAPINTPGVILCRGWAIEQNGRKTWIRANIEDGTGRALVTAKTLFISPRSTKV
jgi:acyl-coenzyme A thioesterase PaaI-like protein